MPTINAISKVNQLNGQKTNIITAHKNAVKVFENKTTTTQQRVLAGKVRKSNWTGTGSIPTPNGSQSYTYTYYSNTFTGTLTQPVTFHLNAWHSGPAKDVTLNPGTYSDYNLGSDNGGCNPVEVWENRTITNTSKINNFVKK